MSACFAKNSSPALITGTSLPSSFHPPASTPPPPFSSPSKCSSANPSSSAPNFLFRCTNPRTSPTATIAKPQKSAHWSRGHTHGCHRWCLEKEARRFESQEKRALRHLRQGPSKFSPRPRNQSHRRRDRRLHPARRTRASCRAACRLSRRQTRDNFKAIAQPPFSLFITL